MAEIMIYGASDDLIEVDGAIREEWYLGVEGTTLRITDDNTTESLDVHLNFSSGDGSLDWSIEVKAINDYPSWPIRFTERPGYEGDPAVVIDVPEDFSIVNLSEEDED